MGLNIIYTRSEVGMVDAIEQELYKAIGARIREFRLAQHMSQATLAEKANISLPHMSKIENGKCIILLSTFIRITEVLQVSSDTLLRSDIPQVKTLYNSELAELLNDCTPMEIDAILKIVKEVKRSFQLSKAEEPM